MNNYMLFIKAIGNPISGLSEEQQGNHIQKVGGFIQGLISEEKMKDAQPLIPGGMIVSNRNGVFSESKMNEDKEMISGYYQIQANDISEATKIAKSDPRFEDGEWVMEIRQIMKIDGINE